MKFTAGYWEMRPEVTARFPVEVHEVQTDPEGMTIHATTQKLVHRGDTLNQFPITVRFSSPMENVIRVQIYHHKGRRPREPEFALKPQPAPLVDRGRRGGGDADQRAADRARGQDRRLARRISRRRAGDHQQRLARHGRLWIPRRAAYATSS